MRVDYNYLPTRKFYSARETVQSIPTAQAKLIYLPTNPKKVLHLIREEFSGISLVHETVRDVRGEVSERGIIHVLFRVCSAHSVDRPIILLSLSTQ